MSSSFCLNAHQLVSQELNNQLFLYVKCLLSSLWDFCFSKLILGLFCFNNNGSVISPFCRNEMNGSQKVKRSTTRASLLLPAID